MPIGTELAPVRRWERWQQPPATTMPREPYSPQEAAAAADAIWAAIDRMIAEEASGDQRMALATRSARSAAMLASSIPHAAASARLKSISTRPRLSR